MIPRTDPVARYLALRERLRRAWADALPAGLPGVDEAAFLRLLVESAPDVTLTGEGVADRILAAVPRIELPGRPLAPSPGGPATVYVRAPGSDPPAGWTAVALLGSVRRVRTQDIPVGAVTVLSLSPLRLLLAFRQEHPLLELAEELARCVLDDPVLDPLHLLEEVACRDREIARLHQAADGNEAELRSQVRRIEATRSWRLTAPLRRLQRLLAGRAGPAAARRPRPPVLVVEDQPPLPRLGAGLPRTAQMIEALDQLGSDVVVYATAAQVEAVEEARRALPSMRELHVRGGLAGLRALLRKRSFDLIVACRPHNLALVTSLREEEPELLGPARLVYDAEAIFSLREARRRTALGLPTGPDGLEAELAAAAAADVVLAVTPEERQLFAEAGHARVTLLGLGVEPRPGPVPFGARRDLLFVGPCDTPGSPNEDGLRWLAAEVMPRLARHVDGVQVQVAGKSLPQHHELAASGINLLGPLADVSPLYDSARVFVAPTRFAAGLPLKVLEAASRGVPVVTTRLVADLLGWADGVELLAAESAEGFAARCRALLADEDLWSRLRAAALERVIHEHSPAAFRATLADLLLAGAR